MGGGREVQQVENALDANANHAKYINNNRFVKSITSVNRDQSLTPCNPVQPRLQIGLGLPAVTVASKLQELNSLQNNGILEGSTVPTAFQKASAVLLSIRPEAAEAWNDAADDHSCELDAGVSAASSTTKPSGSNQHRRSNKPETTKPSGSNQHRRPNKPEKKPVNSLLSYFSKSNA